VDALQQRASTTHAPIASFTAITDAEIDAAVAAAREATVAVVALGEDAYAEWIGDLSDLALPASQQRLAHAIMETGTPTVIVLLEGRPRIIACLADGAAGIVMAYWPGMEGAEALADVLFGDVNPSGRLPFTYPRAPNALATYDHRYTETLDAGLERRPGGFNPQFAFGHGLSYTTFSYGDLTLDRPTLGPMDTLRVCVTVTNTGARAGTETVLLYSRQHYASITPAERRLRAFDRVQLQPGASQTVQFALAASDLAFIGRDLAPRVEPGRFDIAVGGLTAAFDVVP
jgi:beta-glucosidase